MKIGSFFTGLVIYSSVSLSFSISHFFDSKVLKPFFNDLQDIHRKLDDSFNILTDPIYDDYSVRIKEVDPAKLGIDSVKQWSGYLDYKDSKHFFYWYFESRNDPVNDPVILWLNGGPGCSSLTGLFFELGPSSIGPDLKPIYNPYSWNRNASIIFLEQPLGVGFSYGDKKVSSTEVAGKDVYVFLELFFQKFPHLRANDFHIAGESYAGHYIPQIAHEIAINHYGIASFNLSSVLIGNGLTDTLVQYAYYSKMACGEGGYPSVLTPEKCQEMEDSLPLCLGLTEECYDTRQTFVCIAASTYCTSHLYGPYRETGLNMYDIRRKCEESDNGLCYKGLDYVTEYLNQRYVQDALGSDVHSYVGCSKDVSSSFALTGDHTKPFQQFVAELADRDIPVLLYSGDKDYICNWLGNHAWSDELEWKSKDEFKSEKLKPWISEQTGESSGEVKNYGSLTFLRVYDAGHMVPYDQPEASLEMLNTWISGDYSFGY
ncbi:LAFE_0H12112g1_1 [Lachancea fermentati]|uniref:Carboxypeptidase n=1 Tax=Lachancea fermentati TaxID=4955 RepID=A0A1G4MKF6_LACFM|nr:LAFE_0H12112g1_1 [Lachancea fermentati]